MDALKKATDKPLIVINESMQFSAGVNLSYTMNFAEKNDFRIWLHSFSRTGPFNLVEG